MKVTVRNLIDKAMKTIGVIGAGETASADEAFDAFDLLNEIIGQFNNEDLFFEGSRYIEFNLNGQSSYTIPYTEGGEIKDVYLETSSNYVPLIMMNEQEFITRRFKQESGSAKFYYVDYGYPNSELYLFPLETTGKISITTNQKISTFQTIDDVVDMPDGWMICLRYSLAIRLCSLYNKTPNDDIIKQAVSSKTLLKNTAQKKTQLKFYSDYPCYYRR